MKYFIVIDGGTQNIKAFVFDEKCSSPKTSQAPTVASSTSSSPSFTVISKYQYLHKSEVSSTYS